MAASDATSTPRCTTARRSGGCCWCSPQATAPWFSAPPFASPQCPPLVPPITSLCAGRGGDAGGRGATALRWRPWALHHAAALPRQRRPHKGALQRRRGARGPRAIFVRDGPVQLPGAAREPGDRGREHGAGVGVVRRLEHQHQRAAGDVWALRGTGSVARRPLPLRGHAELQHGRGRAQRRHAGGVLQLRLRPESPGPPGNDAARSGAAAVHPVLVGQQHEPVHDTAA